MTVFKVLKVELKISKDNQESRGLEACLKLIPSDLAVIPGLRVGSSPAMPAALPLLPTVKLSDGPGPRPGAGRPGPRAPRRPP